MIAWLESLPTAAAGVLIVGGFVLAALCVGYAVARSTCAEIRKSHNDRAGSILAVIGVIYAVLLAFVAVGVWDRFGRADARTYEEAASLATVYRDAGSFPHAGRLRAMLRAYVRTVILREWPRMAAGKQSPLSSSLLEAVDRGVRALPVSSLRLAGIQAQMLAATDTALMDRQTRLTIDSGGINGMMWVVLILGAFVTVAFTYLFGFDRMVMQQLMVGGLSFLIGLVLFVVLAMDFPFRGSIAVGPEAFRALMATFKAIGR